MNPSEDTIADHHRGAPQPDTHPSGRDTEVRALHHSVANSLQLAANFLLLQQPHVEDPHARRVLEQAARRMVAVGHLHRFLFRAESRQEIDASQYLKELGSHLVESTGVPCAIEADDICLSGDIAQQLAILINEIVARHASQQPGEAREGVRIELRGRRGGADLILTGSGVNYRLAAAGSGGQSLGTTIIDAIIRQLSADLLVEGARMTIAFPLPAPREGRSFRTG